MSILYLHSVTATILYAQFYVYTLFQVFDKLKESLLNLKQTNNKPINVEAMAWVDSNIMPIV